MIYIVVSFWSREAYIEVQRRAAIQNIYCHHRQLLLICIIRVVAQMDSNHVGCGSRVK
jgi:hypothetical protein